MDQEASPTPGGGTHRKAEPQKRSVGGALKAGWVLTGSSWAVLRTAPSLVLASLGALVLGAAAVGVDVLVWGGVDGAFGGNVFAVAVRSLPLLVVLHSLAVLSEAVIVGAARMRLAGGEAGLVEGWRVAARRLHTLIGYGFLRALERTFTFMLSAFKAPGRLVGDLIDAAWDFTTFLAIPVILFERPRVP